MTWTLHRQHQQRGAQLHARSDKLPKEAVAGREAQEHDKAGDQPRPDAGYPTTQIQDRDGDDNTPTAPTPSVEWDEVVQPERQPKESDDG